MSNDLKPARSTAEELELRITELAKSKSRLELINRLLTSLSAVAGLDNMVPHILDILMQTVGAANISIIFKMNNSWQYRDIFGENRPFCETDNQNVTKVLGSGKPLRINNPESQVPYPGDVGFVTVENWIFPLLSQERTIGAICMDGMQLNDINIFDELLPFFVYAGVMLDNEISNYSQLAEAHRRLQDSETLYRTLFEQSPDGIVLWSVPELKALQSNTASQELHGYSREEFATLTVSDIEATLNPAEVALTRDTLLRDGVVTFDSVHRTKSGDIRHMFVSLKMIELAGQPMILDIHRDITERKRNEEFMALMNFALDNIREAAYLIDKNARFHYVNAEACRALGYSKEELLNMGVPDLGPEFPIDRWPGHWRELKEQGSQLFESLHQRKDGEHFPVEITANYFEFNGIGYNLALARDISAQKKAEEERSQLEKQLLHAQKLESLGVLAGGIAHDFNNILMAILGNTGLALMRINKESPAVDNLHRIEQATEKAADLAKQMLAYSGKGKFVVENIDLNLLLEEMLHLLDVSISKKAVMRLNPQIHLPTVEADATQMRQIIMNLVINASEAIGDKSGFISITTGCMDCDRIYLKDGWLDENLTDGLYVYLEIADTGCGMNRDTLAKLFDPFFTTKFTGRGLGMAAVLGIVRGHKGTIKVYSEVGRGTAFKILLPASGKPVDLFKSDKKEDDWQGSGTVLLVDDEETILGLGAEMLNELGFKTITANDGREAIEVFKSTPGISMVILDLTMPHMDGEQCFRELRQLDPDIRVIMSSGFNEQEVTQKFVGKGLAGFIQKPYRFSTLKEAIRGIEHV